MDPTALIIILGILVLISLVFVMYFINSKFAQLKDLQSDKEKDEILTKWLENMQGTFDVRLKGVEGTMDNRLRNVQEQLDKTTNVLNKRVDESARDMNTRLDKAAEVISEVGKELGSMSEIGRSMKELQSFFKSPKLRGNIGEQVLKELLEEMLPNGNFILQYTFKSGERVDAILKVDEGYISVDSKFPMENFNEMIQKETEAERERFRKDFIRDVKKHIDDISKKYIVPSEGTVDFALMYIPSEAIYYEVVVNNPELGKYSWGKRVLPVSPNVFYSYLKAILIGLEGKKVESRAKEILIELRGIKEDSIKFNESLSLLTKHFTNARNTLDDVNKEYEKIDNRIGSLQKLPATEEKQLPTD